MGAGIQLPANSSRILDELGLLQTVKRASTQPRKLFIRSYCQDKLHEQDLNPAIEQKFQYPHLLIHRATLIQILYAEAQSQGATVHFGACVGRVDLETPKVELVNGRQYEADLILGADGEHSVCREFLLGRRDPPRSSGDMVFRLSIPFSKINLQPSLVSFIDPPSVHAWYGPNSHAVCYPLSKEEIFNVVLTFSENADAATIGPQVADLDAIRQCCRKWDPEFQHLLRLADKAAKWTLLQTEELETWGPPSGRLVLLGDSAHATLPYLYVSFLSLRSSAEKRRGSAANTAISKSTRSRPRFGICVHSQYTSPAYIQRRRAPRNPCIISKPTSSACSPHKTAK